VAPDKSSISPSSVTTRSGAGRRDRAIGRVTPDVRDRRVTLAPQSVPSARSVISIARAVPLIRQDPTCRRSVPSNSTHVFAGAFASASLRVRITPLFVPCSVSCMRGLGWVVPAREDHQCRKGQRTHHRAIGSPLRGCATGRSSDPTANRYPLAIQAEVSGGAWSGPVPVQRSARWMSATSPTPASSSWPFAAVVVSWELATRRTARRRSRRRAALGRIASSVTPLMASHDPRCAFRSPAVLYCLASPSWRSSEPT